MLQMTKTRITIAVFVFIVGATIGNVLGRVLIPAKTIVIDNTPSMYNVVLECEKMSAVATNKDWSYNTCRKNLKETIKGQPEVLKTI